MAKTLPIITNPSPILRQISEKVGPKDFKNKNFKILCEDMVKTMHERDGIGLAAPQVGYNIRVIVINKKDNALCMINPEIRKKSFRKEFDEEGCLSVPGYYGKVKRPHKIICQYFDTENNEIKIEATGLLARVIQHEMDHLDGILFIDKAKEIRKVDLV